MNTEDFEHKLRSHDPAKHLEMRDTAEARALLEQAISGRPTNVIPISTWSKRRKVASAATAAILVIGFGGPIISGATSASPDRLVFGTAQENVLAEKSANDLNSRNTAMGDYSMGAWGFNHYELNPDAVVNLPTSAVAYKVVNIANVESRIKEIAKALGIESVVPIDSEDGETTFSNQGEGNFYAWTKEGLASFSFYNADSDPWRDCYKTVDKGVDSNSPEECDPQVENLLTFEESKAASKDLLAKLGFETDNLKFEISNYNYSVDVIATVQVDGIDSPTTFYLSFVSNGDLYTVSGSLTKLVAIDTYDLISVEKSIERANSITDRVVERWNKDLNSGSTEVTPGNSGSKDGEDGQTSEPSDPTVPSEPSAEPTRPTDEPTDIEEPIGPVPAYEPTTVRVSKVDLGYQMFWMADQSVLWLPVVNFYGDTEYFDEIELYGTIAAIVDSQIDLDSLYGYL